MNTRILSTALLLPFLGSLPAWGDSAHHHDEEYDHNVHTVRSGHIDLVVRYDENIAGLSLAFLVEDEHAHDEHDDHDVHDDHERDHGSALDVDDVRLALGAAATFITPGDGSLSFLGAGDAYVFVLPQGETSGLPFLGLSGEGLHAEDFSVAPSLRLLEVEGPGVFFLYQLDAFGVPTLLLDGGSEDLRSLAVPVDAHVHHNWAFTTPGDYVVTFEVVATLSDGTALTSPPQPLFFSVFGPAQYFHEDHGDLALRYDPEAGLEFFFDVEGHGHGHGEHEEEAHDEHDDHEEDHGLHPGDVIVLLGGHAVKTVPEETALSFLGTVGNTYFSLPAQRESHVPFLGWNAEALDAELFGSSAEIELHAVTGPGDVFLYAIGATGEVTVYWDSTATGEQAMEIPLGGHRHFHLAVTAPGTYALELHGKATLVASGETVEGHTVVTLQAGGLEGFFDGEFHRPAPYWISAETGGWFYTKDWPWLWSLDQGWVYAWGHGGPSHYYFSSNRADWIWTNPDVFPALWSWGDDAWLLW